MNIEAFIITWNREDIIHLTINHYKQFCSKVTLFDNFSDDKTREIAESLGAEVKLFGKAGELNDQHYLDVKNHCWKGSKADWVIVCDDDEILYNPNLVEELSKATNYTILQTQGYEMYSNEIPIETWLEVNTGIKAENYSKHIIFKPTIKEIGYVYGCHEARPKGDYISYGKLLNPLMVLHYRSVGGPDRLIARQNLYQQRLSAINKKWNLGHHYSISEDQKRREWKESYERSETLF